MRQSIRHAVSVSHHVYILGYSTFSVTVSVTVVHDDVGLYHEKFRHFPSNGVIAEHERGSGFPVVRKFAKNGPFSHQ